MISPPPDWAPRTYQEATDKSSMNGRLKHKTRGQPDWGTNWYNDKEMSGRKQGHKGNTAGEKKKKKRLISISRQS